MVRCVSSELELVLDEADEECRECDAPEEGTKVQSNHVISNTNFLPRLKLFEVSYRSVSIPHSPRTRFPLAHFCHSAVCLSP